MTEKSLRPRKIKFSKLQATGNDFILFENDMPRSSRKTFVKNICNRNFGIGADGAVFLLRKGGRTYWDFYNSDGSPAKMCGNAARCVGLYESDLNGKRRVRIVGAIGEFEVHVESRSKIRVLNLKFRRMGAIKTRRFKKVSRIDSGVPHAVVAEGSPSKAEFKDIEILRRHKSFKTGGANVTFYRKTSASSIDSVTFERGVEGFTLSCGTGAIASAADFVSAGDKWVAVRVPGGNLKVKINNSDCTAELVGPAEVICRGIIEV